LIPALQPGIRLVLHTDYRLPITDYLLRSFYP